MSFVARLQVATAMTFVLSSPALAQRVPATELAPPATQTTPPPTGPAASDAGQDGSGTIGDVVVTASRFNESAQRTAIPLAVIDSAQLKGVTDVTQLQSVNPGIQLGNSGGTTQTFIRGVGSLAATSFQESSVSFNADGVFLFTPPMITPTLYDLDRIEVLKGPQGTLYGRNASGGAVNIITAGAALGHTSGYVEGELGNYDLKRVVGAINLPLGDTLAVRVAGQHVDHSGYLSDGTDDQNLTSARIRLLWEPNADISLKLGTDYSAINSIGPGSSVNPNPTTDKFVGALDPRLNTGPFYLGGYSLLSAPPNPSPFLRDRQWSVFGQLDAKLGFATLTILPSYRYENLSYRDYGPGYQDSEAPRTHETSVEVRLANRSDALKWVIGGYYLNVAQSLAIQIRNESNFQNQITPDYRPHIQSYAFFGEATYSLTSRLRAIGGLRYTHDQTRSTGNVNSVLGPPGVTNPFTGLPNVQTAAFNPFGATNPTGELLDFVVDARSTSSAVSWKGGAEFDVAPQSLVFATVSRGFKGGGTYIDIAASNPSFRPEFLTAYELGSRNRFFDNRLQVNGEFFYWKLTDQQVPYVGFNQFGQVTFLTANAGKAHMVGGNIDVVWKVGRNDTLTAAAEYNHSRYDSFVRVAPSLTVLPNTLCAVTGYGGPTSQARATIDCSGQQVLRAPEWTGSASYEHRFDLASAGRITFHSDVTYASSRFLTPSYTYYMHQPAAAVVNASLTYGTANDGFTLSGWVRNAANARVLSGGEEFVANYARPTLQSPRTFGATARYNF